MQVSSACESMAVCEVQAAAFPHEHLVDLMRTLAMQGYRFTTVTPLTHERFLSRCHPTGSDVRDIFGWNLPFRMNTLSPLLRSLMSEAELTESYGDYVKSKVRVSSLGDDLFLHSAFPTTAADAVFFGPDTYRFARFIRQSLLQRSAFTSLRVASHNLVSGHTAEQPLRLLDIGCGSGAGGIAAVRALRECQVKLTLNDINPAALDYARVNTSAAALHAEFVLGDVFETCKDQYDLIISNPPFMMDSAERAYRNGGARLGLELSVRIVLHAINHLAPQGQLLLYTGVAMTGHKDPLMAELAPLLAEAGCHWSYEEIDPDIFSEDLEQPAYAKASRIAAVGLVVTRPS